MRLVPYNFLIFLFILYSPFALGRYQVCSITINSADEIEVFKQFLPSSDFHFVELLPSKFNEAQDHSSHWFEEACETGVQCDMLVVSCHFGGICFGKSGYALPTELLEEKACKNECKGILSNVKEIFLLGCNTLAPKEKSSRTDEEYLDVLLDYNMAIEDAERVVAIRHTPIGTSFRPRMNFAFSGSDVIYGFYELSPFGKHSRQPLRNYFQSINSHFGSYARYLESGQHKRRRNHELFDSFGGTLDQVHVSLLEPKQEKFFHNKCLLYDEGERFAPRIQALQDIFESGESGSAFFAIDYFLNRNRKEIMEGAGRRIFRYIRTNKSFAGEFRSYYKHLHFLPYIKLAYLNVLEGFQWIDPFPLKVARKQGLLDLIQTPNSEAYTSLLVLLGNNQIKPGEIYISKEDLPEDYIQNIWCLFIFRQLRAEAPDWQSDILKFCKDNIAEKPGLCHAALNTLAHIHPRLEIAQEVVAFLDSKDNRLVYYTIRMLGQSKIKDCAVHEKIASFLASMTPWLREEALEALGFLRSPCTRVQSHIVKLLPNANEKTAKAVFWSLSRMDISSTSAQRRVIQYALHRTNNKTLVEQAFRSLENTSKFSDFTLSFFYEHLETRDNLDFLLFIVESLARNKKLRDLGIHYRFLQFQREDFVEFRNQREKFVEFKREVLKRMASLTWLHPEVQIGFLNYIRDEDPVVRRLAVNILRNINNLQTKTVRQIKALYESEKIVELKDFYSVL